MSFDLKPTHPVKQPCCGGTKVDDIVWTEDRETLPEFLKDKGVSLELWHRRLRDDRSIRAAARAERAALIASVGGIDNLDSFWGRRDKTRQQRDRESRAANFGRRPRFSGMFFF